MPEYDRRINSGFLSSFLLCNILFLQNIERFLLISIVDFRSISQSNWSSDCCKAISKLSVRMEFRPATIDRSLIWFKVMTLNNYTATI